MRESGFDTSNRFRPFSGDTHHYAPVCLNSLLYRYERDLEHLALLLGNVREAAHWDRRSQLRAAAIQRYLGGLKTASLQTSTLSTPALRVMPTSLRSIPLGRFRHARTGNKDGIEAQPLRASRRPLHQRHQHRPAMGRAVRLGSHKLDRRRRPDAYGFRADAARIAQHFDSTVDNGFAADGTIREKYNVVAGNSNVKVSAGYTTNEIGFGWTNAVYLMMKEVMQKQTITSAN